MYTYICIHIYIYMYKQVCTYIYTYIFVNMCMFLYIMYMNASFSYHKNKFPTPQNYEPFLKMHALGHTAANSAV